MGSREKDSGPPKVPPEREKISIIYNGLKRNLHVHNGRVKKSVVTENFGSGRLIYQVDDEDFTLEADKDGFVLEPGVFEYHFEPSSNGPTPYKKNLKFDVMLQKLYEKEEGKRASKRSCATDEKIAKKKSQAVERRAENMDSQAFDEDEKVSHNSNENRSPNKQKNDFVFQNHRRFMPVQTKKAVPSSANLPYLKRIVKVRCMYADHLNGEFERKGSELTVQLNGNKQYSVEDVKIKFKSELHKECILTDADLEPHACIIDVGLLNCSAVTEFTNAEGMPCTFWQFCKRYRNSRNEMRLSLLVKKIAQAPDNETKSEAEEGDTSKIREPSTPSSAPTSIKDDIMHAWGSELSCIDSPTKSSPSTSTKCDMPASEPEYNNEDVAIVEEENCTNHPNKSMVDGKEPDEKSADIQEEYCQPISPCKYPDFNCPSNSNDDQSSDQEDSFLAYDKAIKKVLRGIEERRLKIPQTCPSDSIDNPKNNVHSDELDTSLPSPNPTNTEPCINSNGTPTPDIVSTPPMTCDNKAEHCVNMDSSFVKPSTIVKRSTKRSMLPYEVDASEVEIIATENVGKGSQGSVTKGKFRLSIVAIKSIPRGPRDQLSRREIALLIKLPHPNIIQFMAWFQTPTQIHIVMELFDGHNIWQVVMDENLKREYDFESQDNQLKALLGCSYGLAFCHLQKPDPVIHRDLKLANILINKAHQVKICDFGFGKCTDLDVSLLSEFRGNTYGTYTYMAPEILIPEEYAASQTESSVDKDMQAEMWAYGCCATEIFNGEYLWRKKGNKMLIVMDQLRARKVPDFVKVPDFLQSLLSECFSYEPSSRPGIEAFVNLLSKRLT